MSSKFNLRAAVLDLLLLEVDAILEGDRPDVLIDYRRYSRHTLATCSAEVQALIDAADAEWLDAVVDAESKHDARRLGLARYLYRRYAKAALRFNLSVLGEEYESLRKLANRWLAAAKAKASEQRELAELTRVYVYLTVKDAVEWELAQSETVTLDDLVTASFGDARASDTYDGGSGYERDAAGNEHRVDHRPVHVVGTSHRFYRVA